MRTRELKVGFVVIVVMCACAFFTTQCDGVGNLPDAIYVAPGEPEIPEEPDDLLSGEEKYIPEVATMDADELNGHVKCPSPAKTGEEYELVGKWKLMLRVTGTDTVDCSCEEVIYHFKPDQTLTVSTGNETADDVAYEYDWGFPFCPACNISLTPRPNLRMGSSEVYCWALPEKMFVYPQYREKYAIECFSENDGLIVAIVPLFKIQWLFVRID